MLKLKQTNPKIRLNVLALIDYCYFIQTHFAIYSFMKIDLMNRNRSQKISDIHVYYIQIIAIVKKNHDMQIIYIHVSIYIFG